MSSIGDLKKFSNELQSLKNKAKRIEKNLPMILLSAIRDRANQYLENRVGFYKGTANISQQWSIYEESNGNWVLINLSDEGAYVEFGTGIKGENSHDIANEVNYEYDVSKHGTEGWNWYDKWNGILIRGFTGYSGKSFLYDAYYDYIVKGEWQTLLEREFKR